MWSFKVQTIFSTLVLLVWLEFFIIKLSHIDVAVMHFAFLEWSLTSLVLELKRVGWDDECLHLEFTMSLIKCVVDKKLATHCSFCSIVLTWDVLRWLRNLTSRLTNGVNYYLGLNIILVPKMKTISVQITRKKMLFKPNYMCIDYNLS